MKIFNMFVLCANPKLTKQQFRLCLILLDLYDRHSTNRFNIAELYNHRLMTVEIKETMEVILETIVTKKIMCKNQWQYTIPNETLYYPTKRS
jgi:hypothetical protein